MADAHVTQLVEAALALRKSHPQAPALDALDMAMEGHRGSDPDFCTYAHPAGDWLDAATPFGQLLAEAFGYSGPVDEAPGFPERWQTEVIDRFGARYALWCSVDA